MQPLIIILALVPFWLGFTIGKMQLTIPNNLSDIATLLLVAQSRGQGRRDEG